MKVIDLLNKIANGEDVPKKIKYKGFELKRTQSEIVKRLYVDEQDCFFPEYYSFSLNDEIQIIDENKKIEKLKDKNFEDDYGCITKNDMQFIDKINEIIDKINELENKQ